MAVRIGFRLMAVGFTAAALVHAGEGIAGILGYQLRDYPLWRHGLFVLLDAGLALIAVRSPRLLWAPLLLVLAQQTTTHGREVWDTWRSRHDIAWLSLSTMIFLIASAILAIRYRWCGRVTLAGGSDAPGV